MYFDYDEALTHVGGFGLYQVLTSMLLSVFLVNQGAQTMVSNFLNPTHDHWCTVQQLLNLSEEQQKHIAIPWHDQEHHQYEQCVYYNLNWDNFTSEEFANWNRTAVVDSPVTSCSSWQFSEEVYHVTMTSKWSLVCGDAYIRELTSTLFVLGSTVGCFLSGILSDRFGRKPILPLFVLGQLVMGFGVAFAPSAPLLLLFRTLQGIFIRGLEVTTMVYVMEPLGVKHRVAVGSLVMVMWPVGGMMVAGVAQALRDFTWIMVVINTPMVLMVSCWWLLCESPRWLIFKGRYSQALEVIKVIGRVNRRTVPDHIIHRDSYQNYKKNTIKEETVKVENVEHYSMADIFKNKALTKFLLICWLDMIATMVTNYILTFNVDELFGDVYMNVFLSCLTEIPVYIMTTLALVKLGRRLPVLSLFAVAALASIAAIPFELTSGDGMVVTVASMIVRSAVQAQVGCMYVYMAELFPTPIRQVAVGSTMAVSACFSIASPYLGGPLRHVFLPLPYMIMAVLCTSAFIATWFLPETMGQKIPDTIQEAEALDTSSPKKEVHTLFSADNESFNMEEPGPVLQKMNMKNDRAGFTSVGALNYTKQANSQ